MAKPCRILNFASPAFIGSRVCEMDVEFTGSPDGSNGVETVVLRDQVTRVVVQEKTYLVDDGQKLLIKQRDVLALDDSWRPTLTTTLRGTNETVSGAWGWVRRVNEEAIVATFKYDVLRG